MRLPIKILITISLGASYTNIYAIPSLNSNFDYSWESKRYSVNGIINIKNPRCKNMPLEAKIVESYYENPQGRRNKFVPLNTQNKTLFINNTPLTKRSEYRATGYPQKAQIGSKKFRYRWNQKDTDKPLAGVKAWLRDDSRRKKTYEETSVHKRFKLVLSSGGSVVKTTRSFSFHNDRNSTTVPLRPITSCP